MDEGVEKREGTKFAFAEPDPDRVIVSMIDFQGRIYVATQKGVYRFENGKMTRLEFIEETNGRRT